MTKEIRSDAENNLKEAEKNLNQLKIDKKKFLIEAKNESEILKKEILAQEKIAIERLHNRLSDRIRQTTNEAITDIKNISLNIAIKSVKDFLKSQDNEKQKNITQVKRFVNFLAQDICEDPITTFSQFESRFLLLEGFNISNIKCPKTLAKKKRIEEEKRLAEEKRKEEEKIAEEKRKEEERLAEEKRKEEERLDEEKRKEEER